MWFLLLLVFVRPSTCHSYEKGAFCDVYPYGEVRCFKTGISALKHLPLDFTKLYFSANLIPVLENGPFKNFTMLENLDLSYNQIEVIEDSAFERLHNLKKLTLRFNKVRTIKENAFHSTPLVTHINLYECEINSMQNLSKSLALLTKLEEINLEYNQLLESILKDDLMPLINSSHLAHLNFKNCMLTNIGPAAFEPIKNLKTLHLSGNEISIDKLEDAFINIANTLENLYLDDMNLKAMPRNALYHLQKCNLGYLNLEGNRRITHIHYEDMPSFPFLKTLILRDCSITYLHRSIFSKSPNIQVLDLSRNYLTRIDDLNWIYSGPNLIRLDLSFNNISVFPLGVQVQDLDIHGNNIEKWDEPFAIAFTSLQKLDISKNNITVITEAMLSDFKYLTTLFVANNPFDCTKCNTCNLKNWYATTSVNIEDKELMVCSNPEKFRGQLLISMDTSLCFLNRMYIIAGFFVGFVVLTSVLTLVVFYFKRKFNEETKHLLDTVGKM